MSDETLQDDPLITLEDGFDGLDRAYNSWNVARAEIRSDNGGGTLHILVGISAAERSNKRVPDEQVRARAIKLRDAMVHKHREEARGLDGQKTIRAWWKDPLPTLQ